MDKIIIGVLACDKFAGEDYTNMVQACRDTCYSKIEEGIKVYYLYGHREGVEIPEKSYKIDGDCFYNDSPEGRNNCLAKTVAFFEHCIENEEFDYIFRANCGSYIDQKILKTFSEKLSKEKTYCGIWGNVQGVPYCSGAGYFLSKDLVKLVINNKKRLQKTGIDDISVGEIIYRNGVDRTGGAYREDVILDEIIRDDFFINKNCYHYYFKHTIEPKCFYELHKKINKED